MQLWLRNGLKLPREKKKLLLFFANHPAGLSGGVNRENFNGDCGCLFQWSVTGGRWQVLGETRHMTHDRWHLTHDTGHFFPFLIDFFFYPKLLLAHKELHHFANKKKFNKFIVTHDTWHLTPDMWHVVGVNIFSKCLLPSCYSLSVTMFWRFGGKWQMNQWMNQWVNDKGFLQNNPG